MQSIHSDKAPATAAPAKRSVRNTVRLGAVALLSLVGGVLGASACLDRPLCDEACRPTTTNIFVDSITQNSVDKIDLLLMVDNSISMADKQKVLAAAIPDLVQRLVSPNCVDANGVFHGDVVKDPQAACPPTLLREFTPISNIHIGVITSSLGDHGDNDTCLGNDADPIGEEQDDHGHLIATRPRFKGESAKPAYAGQPFQAPEPTGFLDWNPATRGGKQDIDQFNTTFSMMVTASSEFGCGLESQLEAIYRFLADPAPPQSIAKVDCPNAPPGTKCAAPTGKDTDLLAQRAAFLRPDSLVAVIMVTDENDCSIRDTQQFFYAARTDIVLPNGTSVCATNPNDPCCYSCASHGPAQCGDPHADPNCQAAPIADNDPINLRCFHEKQRFGLDFLYPTKRYVNAFKSPQLCTSQVGLDFDPTNQATCPDADNNGKPDVVQNPLYTNPNGLPRAQNLVFVAGIIGVPWQDIQATADKNNMAYPPAELHYMTASDLTANKKWDLILGDPTASPPLPPSDGLMAESEHARNGNDVNNKPIPGPAATPQEDNAINGHDWGNGGGDDLMYACIFQLAENPPRDCTQVELQKPAPGCDCGSAQAPGDNNPLCRAPGQANYGTVQYFAKGYPGIRELQVLKDYGNNSIIASICARNLTDKTKPDYGYRPAVDAIVDRLKEALTGKCLPRTLAKDKSGKYPCSILEVQPRQPGGCNYAPGRVDPSAVGHSKVIAPAQARLRSTGVCDGTSGVSCDSFQYCELVEAGPTCHQNIPNPQQPGAGWCYVDPKNGDDQALVAKCPPTEQRIIRFVDPKSATPAQGSQVLIACFGAQLTDE